MTPPDDRAVRTWLTRFIAEQGCAPRLVEAACALGCSPEDVAASYRRLHDAGTKPRTS